MSNSMIRKHKYTDAHTHRIHRIHPYTNCAYKIDFIRIFPQPSCTQRSGIARVNKAKKTSFSFGKQNVQIAQRLNSHFIKS